eukprot:16143493-Heterocapsa_arctica.AAC.1
MIGVPWDKTMGKTVRRLAPDGLPWQPPSSAPVATEEEEAAERGEPAQPEEGAAQNEGMLAAPPTPRARATTRPSEDLEKMTRPERKKLKEERARTSTLT